MAELGLVDARLGAGEVEGDEQLEPIRHATSSKCLKTRLQKTEPSMGRGTMKRLKKTAVRLG